MVLSELPDREKLMLLIDGSYLYEIGKAIQPLHELTQEDTNYTAWLKCHAAKLKLEEFLTRSVYVEAIHLCVAPAKELIENLQVVAGDFPKSDHVNEKIEWVDWYNISENLKKFETIFQAEFKNGNMFLATPKGGFDLRKMILKGECLFPATLPEKVPDAIPDVKEGAMCIAFELYTASGFHLHRANESVLLKYYDSISKGKKRPENRNLGKYIAELAKLDAPQAITSCLRDLKDMHRNPLMHPEQSIDNLDDSIALLNSIYTSMAIMLKAIPDPCSSD